ncbi:hypothetical protein [Sphaerisporangium fuscum]|nr:hypothetical protein [Sphaerisporangium fuscum]
MKRRACLELRPYRHAPTVPSGERRACRSVVELRACRAVTTVPSGERDG